MLGGQSYDRGDKLVEWAKKLQYNHWQHLNITYTPRKVKLTGLEIWLYSFRQKIHSWWLKQIQRPHLLMENFKLTVKAVKDHELKLNS